MFVIFCHFRRDFWTMQNSKKKIEPTKSTRDEKRTHMWQKEGTNNVFRLLFRMFNKKNGSLVRWFSMLESMKLSFCHVWDASQEESNLGQGERVFHWEDNPNLNSEYPNSIPLKWRTDGSSNTNIIIGGFSSHVCLITRRYIYIHYTYYIHIYTLWVYISVFDTSYIMLV